MTDVSFTKSEIGVAAQHLFFTPKFCVEFIHAAVEIHCSQILQKSDSIEHLFRQPAAVVHEVNLSQ